tara:strand:+ start:1370 stop:1831 length:462 start_codon:yes stop_codon:yes gene_type:complete
MIFIPNELFFIVYQFVGPKALYLNKEYYHFLEDKKRQFIEKPIRLEYKIVQWFFNEQFKRSIINISRRKPRPTMKVIPDLHIDISGNYGIHVGNNNEITIQQKLADIIIPPQYQYNRASIYVNTTTVLSEIYSLYSENINYLKEYSKIWNIFT